MMNASQVPLKQIVVSCCAAAVLAATGPARAATEKTLYSFLNGKDGAVPEDSLIDVGDLLYGTARYGGSHSRGAVFKINRTTGAESIVHSLGAHEEGEIPVAGLLNVDGMFYGSTTKGGLGYGVIFKMTPAGADTVLYNFKQQLDGVHPQATLTQINSTTFFGTTLDGGASGIGTVFSVTTAGVEKVVYSFKGGVDGANPTNGSLLRVAGRLPLYGTTTYGGASHNGTVYKVTTGGIESVLHAFKGGSDGAYPTGGLILVGGLLWGTTGSGGDATCGSGSGNGCGTVFTVNPDTGVETVVYAFNDASGAVGPYSGLVNLGGTLYGTTYGSGSAGCGTIFSVNPLTGAVAVIYSFLGTNAGDGCFPLASLISKGGTLYGTTSQGGAANRGSVFAVTP